LPADVQQVLPGRSQPQAVSSSRPLVKTSRSLEAMPPASKDAEEEEPLEQLLERAMSRYQSIVAEGNGISWGTDTEACLVRLEAFLKTLKEEARRAAPKPPVPPAKNLIPAAKTSLVLPASALLPASKGSASQIGAVSMASSPSSEAAAGATTPAPPVPAATPLPPAPKPIRPAPTATAANAVVAAPGLPWVTQRPAGQLPASALGPSGGQKMAEQQVQQLAVRIRGLAAELMDLADKLRKLAPVENSQSVPPSTK
jgi:hypothetical protein